MENEFENREPEEFENEDKPEIPVCIRVTSMTRTHGGLKVGCFGWIIENPEGRIVFEGWGYTEPKKDMDIVKSNEKGAHSAIESVMQQTPFQFVNLTVKIDNMDSVMSLKNGTWSAYNNAESHLMKAAGEICKEIRWRYLEPTRNEDCANLATKAWAEWKEEYK